MMYANALACAAPESLDFKPSLCDRFSKKLKTVCLLLRNTPGEGVTFKILYHKLLYLGEPLNLAIYSEET